MPTPYVIAKAAGRARYFTGKPCKHGHVAERFVSNGGCITCYKMRTAKPPRGQCRIPAGWTIPETQLTALQAYIVAHGGAAPAAWREVTP